MEVPPQDIDAEKSVLGAILLDANSLVKVIEFLVPAHFYKDAHKNIYSAIIALFEHREPADLITVPDQLKKMKELTCFFHR